MKRMSRKENIDYWFKNHKATHSTLKDENGKEVEMIIWGEEDTMVCRIYYMLYGNVLMVFGDLGEAIYQWSGKLDLHWISRCNVSYFAGKCQASEEGRRYEVWESDDADEWLKDQADSQADDHEYGLDIDEEEAIQKSAADKLTEELKKLGVETALADPKLWDEFVGNHKEHFGDRGAWLSDETTGGYKLDDVVCELVMEGDYRKEVFKERWLQKVKDAGWDCAIEDETEFTHWMRENGDELFGDCWWELGSPGKCLAIRCEGHLVGLKKAFEWLDAQKEGADGDEAKEEKEAPEEAAKEV